MDYKTIISEHGKAFISRCEKMGLTSQETKAALMPDKHRIKLIEWP